MIPPIAAMLDILVVAIGVLLAIGVGAVLLLHVFVARSERRTLFCPDLEPAWLDPAALGAAPDDLEDVTVTTDDGCTLRGWFYRTPLQRLLIRMHAARDPEHAPAPLGTPTVLYLHGNSGSLFSPDTSALTFTLSHACAHVQTSRTGS